MHPSPRDPATRVRVPAGEPGDPPTTQIERPVRAETELLLALGELARLGERPESPAAVAERALEILVRRFTARTGVAGRIGQEGMEILASIGGPPELVTLARSVRLDESGVLEELFRTHAATLIDLSDPDLPRPELARATAALIGRWLLVIPMTSGVRTRGLLALSWTEEPRLAIDSALFADVGRIVAIALDNAFLRMEMDREIERRSRLEQSALVASIVVDRATEAIVLTDLDFRVRLWSPGAERLYGIPAELALGRHVDELRASSDLDGNPLPARLTPEFLDQGIWRGRIVHRPLLGDAAGRERLVDAVVTVLRDETNRPVALLAVNREVTPTARLEVELATLGSLAVETGRTADPQQIADSALEILTRATGATAALVLFYRGDGYETIARRGLSEETAVLITSFRRIGTRIGQALEDASAIVAADIHEAPLRPEIAAALEADGVGHVLLVGLRIGGELLGLLGLGWPSRPIALPSSPVILQAAALLAGTLENARLVRRLERSVEAEQRLSARLEALVDLTRLPEEASSETIARFLLEQTV
ncbi:MAG TPA: GAF domain-containing protein, partial [Candidatus Limnocylindrales bacterium]|nr:GAF domain-containing protein [Candidatus Limnocylindrales bacterium]